MLAVAEQAEVGKRQSVPVLLPRNTGRLGRQIREADPLLVCVGDRLKLAVPARGRVGDFAEALSRGIELAVAPRFRARLVRTADTEGGRAGPPAPEPATTVVAGNLGSPSLADRRVLS